MPYIEKSRRSSFMVTSKVEPTIKSIDPMEVIGKTADNAGDLNYAITMILKHYIQKKGECYAVHNEIVGMLECCKQEWYRKMVSPYEDKKIEQNGDV
jgi:hypothetical protein